MPTQVLPKHSWDESPSIFDPLYQTLLRKAVQVTGLDDPNTALLGSLNPMATFNGPGPVGNLSKSLSKAGRALVSHLGNWTEEAAQSGVNPKTIMQAVRDSKVTGLIPPAPELTLPASVKEAGLSLPPNFKPANFPKNFREASLAQEGFPGSFGQSPENAYRRSLQQEVLKRVSPKLPPAISTRGGIDPMTAAQEVVPAPLPPTRKMTIQEQRAASGLNGYRTNGPRGPKPQADPDLIQQVTAASMSGKTPNEIARSLGIPDGNVRSILERALRMGQ